MFLVEIEHKMKVEQNEINQGLYKSIVDLEEELSKQKQINHILFKAISEIISNYGIRTEYIKELVQEAKELN